MTTTWVCSITVRWRYTTDRTAEMSVNVDTIAGRLSDHCYNASVFSTSNYFGMRKEKIVIDGLDITANRLFGHRPATSTYVCIWEIHVGDVKAALSAYEARVLSVVGPSFGLNLSDPLNSPAKEYAIPIDPDGTSTVAHLVRFTIKHCDSDVSEGPNRHSECRMVGRWCCGRIHASQGLQTRLQRPCRKDVPQGYRHTTARGDCKASPCVQARPSTVAGGG